MPSLVLIFSFAIVVQSSHTLNKRASKQLLSTYYVSPANYHTCLTYKCQIQFTTWADITQSLPGFFFFFNLKIDFVSDYIWIYISMCYLQNNFEPWLFLRELSFLLVLILLRYFFFLYLIIPPHPLLSFPKHPESTRVCTSHEWPQLRIFLC